MVLLVIDVQKGIMNERLYAFERVRDNILLLIDRAREKGAEVIFVRHDDGEGSGFSKGDDAFEIYEGCCPRENEKIFGKRVNSPFHHSTELLEYLKSKGENEIMTVGLQTDYCMDAAVKSGFEHGFRMIIPQFCNSTFDNKYMTGEMSYRYYNEMMWPERYGECISMEKALEILE